MKLRLYVAFLISLFFTLPVFAWNACGHKVVAQIAYNRLSPEVKEKINTILKARFIAKDDNDRFLFAASWPDRIKSQTKKYNTWHYIDLPIVRDGVKPAAVSDRNVVWAIAHSESIVKSSNYSLKTRAKYLSFLIHFVGDLHQPLHCATLVSNQFAPPEGDLGGNKYFIKAPGVSNLHAYWDQGLGQLTGNTQGGYHSYCNVYGIANDWVNEFPPSFFAKKLAITDTNEWAQESYEVAKDDAYIIPENTAPTPEYIQNGRKVIREQAVLGGYRLANILNQVFSSAS